MVTAYRRRQIVAVVPAYNEAATIAATVAALDEQTRPVDRLLVVANNCTDQTADVARQAGAEVWEMPVNPHRKAGALNATIAKLLPELADDDLLLVTDADSILAPSALAAAVAELDRRPDAGAVCADYRLPAQRGLLGIVQANEYARYSRWVWRRGGRANVLSGVASLFEVSTVRQILAARASGRLPGYVDELYHRGAATEDIELTYAIRSLGYRPRVAPGFDALTDAMPTARALVLQRVRWQRGMVDTLRLYGLRRWNVGDWARQLGMYVGSLLVPAYLAVLAAAWIVLDGVPFEARWLPITALFAIERVWTVRRQGWRGLLTAALLAPEWCYEQLRSFAYWRALWATARGAQRTWINS